MGNHQRFLTKRLLAITLVLSCTIALLAACGITYARLNSTLLDSSSKSLDNLTAIMQNYRHSFELYEQIIQAKINTAADEDEIESYLKQNDATFGKIEGEDYDGVYLYYHGRYIYSWDTPYSVYEESGYNAVERPWYIGAVKADGDIWVEKPYHSYANNYMLSTISRLQSDGETVIAYDIKLGSIQKFAKSLDLYSGSLTLLSDMEGNVIGSNDEVYVGGNYSESQEDLNAQISQLEADIAGADASDAEKNETALTKLEAMETLRENDQQGIHNASLTPGKLSLDWGGGNAVFYSTDGQYCCITVIPLIRVLPQLLALWLLIAAVLVLCILLFVNVKMRIASANALKVRNAELAEAAARADAASAAKSRFLAQMSHEIRTPMNAIIGLTGIAKTEVSQPEKVASYLTKIESSSHLLLSLINDILDMSAIEGGKLKIGSSPFDFRNLLTRLTAMFYEQSKQKGVRFDVNMSGVTEEMLVGDELRVNQVLMNLLSNAMKFTPEGGSVTLDVLQASQSHGKVQFRFRVTDTGCGMDEEMLGRLFQPFEQESAETARKHGGSGLGLSITKHLTEMMGGSIQVQSTPGKGSVFTVDLPFGTASGTKTEVVTDFSKIRTLVVDDDKDSCEYTGILLQRLGVRYDFVLDGESALEALGEAEDRDDPYKLCLIDWRMPGMDGMELTSKIREIFGDDAIVIIVSAYNLDEIADSGYAAGSNYLIPKPLFQSTLYNAMVKITSGAAASVDESEDDFDFGGKHVLIAEDVELNMEVAVKLLDMVGVSADCADDGRKAVDLFLKSAQGQYDCILMDINMPIMDGYEATREIRQSSHPDAKTIPIYAMTANAFAEDVTAALDAGMNGHIAKPIETKVLYRTLASAFGGETMKNGEKSEETQTSK